MNLQETIYSAQHKIGVEEVGPGVRETTLIGLMLECNVFNECLDGFTWCLDSTI